MPAVQRGGFQNSATVRDRERFTSRIITSPRLAVEMLALSGGAKQIV